MPTEYTGMLSRDGKGIAHDDFEECSRCGEHLPWRNDLARAQHWAAHEAADAATANKRAEFKRAELHRIHFCSTCWANAAMEQEMLAVALHAVKGGGGGFGEAGTCECREDAAAIISEYTRLVAEAG